MCPSEGVSMCEPVKDRGGDELKRGTENRTAEGTSTTVLQSMQTSVDPRKNPDLLD